MIVFILNIRLFQCIASIASSKITIIFGNMSPSQTSNFTSDEPNWEFNTIYPSEADA